MKTETWRGTAAEQLLSTAIQQLLKGAAQEKCAETVASNNSTALRLSWKGISHP